MKIQIRSKMMKYSFYALRFLCPSLESSNISHKLHCNLFFYSALIIGLITNLELYSIVFRFNRR